MGWSGGGRMDTAVRGRGPTGARRVSGAGCGVQVFWTSQIFWTKQPDQAKLLTASSSAS